MASDGLVQNRHLGAAAAPTPAAGPVLARALKDLPFLVATLKELFAPTKTSLKKTSQGWGGGRAKVLSVGNRSTWSGASESAAPVELHGPVTDERI